MQPSILFAASVAALVASASAAASDWRTLDKASAKQPGIEYDAARVKYEAPYLTTWTRIELAQAATLSNGVRYRVVLQKVAVDCAKRLWVVTYSEFHDRTEAAGLPLNSVTVPPEEWDPRPAQAGSSGDKLIRALCTTPRPW